MRGNSHVRFLGGGVVAIQPCYPIILRLLNLSYIEWIQTGSYTEENIQHGIGIRNAHRTE